MDPKHVWPGRKAERKRGKYGMRNSKEKPYSETDTSNLTILTENAIELEPPITN